MHAIKALKNKTITILLAVLVAISLAIGTIGMIGHRAKAEIENDTSEFASVPLELSNTQFDASSGNYPATPTSWTGAAADGGSAELVRGVVDLTPSVYSAAKSGNKQFKLDQYDEYKDELNIPKTIFGDGSRYGGDEKALLINTPKGSRTAYAYSSADMSLAPNSFYRFSVWVKTGNFGAGSGATVKLSGLGQYLGFHNINTVREYYDGANLALNEDNDYGWEKYTMYVRTSASLTKSVKLVLGIGDVLNNNGEDPNIMPRPASGYAFFDTVSADRISASTFAAETQHFTLIDGKDNLYTYANGRSLAIDLNETHSFTVDGTASGEEIGTFSQDELVGWRNNVRYDEHDNEPVFVDTAHCVLYNSQSRIKDVKSDANAYGFTKNPWAPYGKAEYPDLVNESPFFANASNANILLISTYDGSSFGKTAYGVASPFVTIERFKYYRFSVWVKGDSVTDGSGISVLVKGKAAGSSNVAKLTEYTNLSGDDADAAHYGWKEQIIYIHGSMLCDYTVSFELWLGSPASQSSGIAMFDNATFTELKYSDYSEMSAADGGNVYSLDTVSNSTNITNGNFINVGDMDEISFPMPVADWNYLTPDRNNTRGFSTAEVNTDNAVHGIIPTDAQTFGTIAANGDIPNVDRPNGNDLNNVLLLSSTTKTAFCYQSPSITLATDTANRITVDLAVGRINGYGASIVLKTTDGAVLSTIENITDTNNRRFKTFTFHLNAPLSDQTVYVEIWLGLNDRKNNESKLSSGNVYVKQVALNTWTAAENSTIADEYNAILEQYKHDVSHRSALASLDYGVYSFTAPTLDYYDAYSYAQSDELGHLYQWTVSSVSNSVKSGMYNADFTKGMELYGGFDSKDLTGNMLYIFNTENNRTTYTYDNSVALVANKYYRIDMNVKVRVSDEIRTDETSVGANIKLVGSTAEFENIKDTTTLVDVNNEQSRDYETFKTYSFYVSTGDNGGSIGLEISLGGETRESYIQGRLVVGGITMTEIDNLDYENAESAAKNDDKIIAVALSETEETPNDTNTEARSNDIQAWVIPSIILSLLLVAGIVLIIVVRIRDHIKSKKAKSVVYASEYDRTDVMNEIERLRAQDEADARAQATQAKAIPAAPAAEPAEQEDRPEQAEQEAQSDGEQTEKAEQSEQTEPAAEQPEKPAPPASTDDLDD